MVASAEGLIGFNPDRRTTDQEYTLMTCVFGDDGYRYFYCQANGTIAATQTDVALTTAGQASDGLGSYANTTAFADDEYGWVYEDAIP